MSVAKLQMISFLTKNQPLWQKFSFMTKFYKIVHFKPQNLRFYYFPTNQSELLPVLLGIFNIHIIYMNQ